MLRLHGELASIVRVHVVRLTVAFGVSVTPREPKNLGSLQKTWGLTFFLTIRMDRFTHPNKILPECHGGPQIDEKKHEQEEWAGLRDEFHDKI